MRIDAIIEYNFDLLEIRAYKLSCIWLDLSRKICPDYEHVRMKNSKKGDPRKSLIFKICYKLVRETQNDILPEVDYPLYVRAQLEIFRYISMNNNVKPFIDPNCLLGDKAWRRWNLWKNKYDSLQKKPLDATPNLEAGAIKAIDGLQKTKEFLTKSLGELVFQKFEEAYINRNLIRWINLGKISPYYIVVSPFLKKLLKPEDLSKMHFDSELYAPCINDSVKNKFKELFPLEIIT